MKVRGTVSKIITELGCGLITCSKIGNIFFSQKTAFSGTSFSNLKVSDHVHAKVIETERGMFAQAIELDLKKRSAPEVSV